MTLPGKGWTLEETQAVGGANSLDLSWQLKSASVCGLGVKNCAPLRLIDYLSNQVMRG